MEEDKKNKKVEFSEEPYTEIPEIPLYDVQGTLEDNPAYQHMLDQVPEESRAEVIEDVKKQTDSWQKVFDHLHESLQDPTAREKFRDLIKQKVKNSY